MWVKRHKTEAIKWMYFRYNIVKNYRLMKTIHLFISAILVFVLSACHHTSEPLYVPQTITQLNTVVAPYVKDNELLPWKGVSHIEIINSVADVYDTQTEKFIKENPNWLNVDFTTKSIISYRTILFASDYWQYTKVKSFSLFVGDQDYHMIKGDYYLVIDEYYTSYDSDTVDEDESQYRIYQIAFVTDKVPSDARIKWNLSMTTTTPKN